MRGACNINHVGLSEPWDSASLHTENMPEKQFQLFIYLNNLECSLKHPHCFSVVQKRAIQTWQPKSWSLSLQQAFMPHSLHSGWGLQVWNLPGHTGMLIEMSGRADGEFLSPLRGWGREYEIYFFLVLWTLIYRRGILHEIFLSWSRWRIMNVSRSACLHLINVYGQWNVR